MAIGVMEVATVSRVQDYTTFKQNEDNKGYINQTVISEDMQKNTEQKMQEVTKQDNADYHQNSFDAREKGSNEYNGDGGNNRKKEPKKREQVIVNGHYGFDIKI